MNTTADFILLKGIFIHKPTDSPSPTALERMCLISAAVNASFPFTSLSALPCCPSLRIASASSQLACIYIATWDSETQPDRYQWSDRESSQAKRGTFTHCLPGEGTYLLGVSSCSPAVCCNPQNTRQRPFSFIRPLSSFTSNKHQLEAVLFFSPFQSAWPCVYLGWTRFL